MKSVSAVLFGLFVYLTVGSVVFAQTAEPPTDELRQEVEKRGQPENLGAIQYNCTQPDWCNYTDPLKSWQTKYYEGRCNGGVAQATECQTGDKNVYCSATTDHNNKYLECHCTNWESKEVQITIRVQCWPSSLEGGKTD